MSAITLYTCGQKTSGPGAMHPCAKAGKALHEAGHEFEIEVVGGYRLMPWTWRSRSRDRAAVMALSGTPEVPILVIKGGDVISGSGGITKWAKQNPHPLPEDMGPPE